MPRERYFFDHWWQYVQHLFVDHLIGTAGDTAAMEGRQQYGGEL